MAQLKNITMRLNPKTIDFLREVAPHSNSMREFIEAAVAGYVLRTIGCAYSPSGLSGMTHGELCEVYLRHIAWQRGEQGYRPIYVQTAGGFGLTDEELIKKVAGKPRKLTRIIKE